MRCRPAVVLVVLSISLIVSAPAARSDDLYEFVVGCKADTLSSCFDRLKTTLDRVRAEEQGRAFCLPRAWYPTASLGLSYPVSLLDYLLLRLSAARVSRPGHPYQAVLRDVLAEMYPCRRSAL